jgi:hypothetical protein
VFAATTASTFIDFLPWSQDITAMRESQFVTSANALNASN